MPRYSERTGLLQEYQVGPFSATHWYVQWGGKLPGTEEWSCGFRMCRESGAPGVLGDAEKIAIRAAIVAFHQAPNTRISDQAKLSFIKINGIGVDGKYELGITQETVYADLPGGGGATSVPPNQIALAIGLTTAVTRGPANRGRFYIPMPVTGNLIDGRMQAGIAVLIKGTAQTLLTAVNAASADEKMAVMSRKAGAPTHRLVTGVQVGLTVDTQRRRRGGVSENYI